MTDVRLDTEVIAVGAMAGEFFAAGMMVLFGDESPPELQEVSVVHHATVTNGEVSPGDVVEITTDGTTHTVNVLAVGPVANDNLTGLGHLVLKRNGLTEHELPGDVCCDTGEIPDCQPGSTIVIRGS